MTKITLNTVGSISQNPTTAAATIDANSAIVQAAMDNTLSRDGTSPNQMENNFDMNNFQIINLPAPATGNSPARLQDLSTITGGGTVTNIPTGGTTGQVLSKHSNTNYDTQWTTAITSASSAVLPFIAAPSSSTLATAIGDALGSGHVVLSTSPTISTPTLTAPIISSITNTGTLTLPTSTDTVVGRATTDTLTNKTISGSSNTLSSVALSSLATQAANTLVGNFTGSSASPTATAIGSLTNKASPAGTDFIIIQDQAASGALKYATVSSISSAGSVGSVNGQTGSIVSYFPPQGRLTLTTATPVMKTTVSGATTVYYTPYVGNMVPIYDGTNMVPTVCAEVSQTTTDTTKSPAAVAVSSVYDIFVWNDSGTIRATRGPAWSTLSTRGYTFTMVNGILLNTSSITNGPAASRGTWVGTIYSNGSSQIDYQLGGSVSGGLAGSLGVWNAYNRVLTTVNVIDSGTAYTYSSSTIREARASTGNQISFVVGALEDGVHAAYVAETALASAVSGSNWSIYIGLNTTSGTNPRQVYRNLASSGSVVSSLTATQLWVPTSLGPNVIYACEAGDGSNSWSFNNSTTNTLSAIIRN